MGWRIAEIAKGGVDRLVGAPRLMLKRHPVPTSTWLSSLSPAVTGMMASTVDILGFVKHHNLGNPIGGILSNGHILLPTATLIPAVLDKQGRTLPQHGCSDLLPVLLPSWA